MKLFQLLTEAKESFEQFAKNRLAGAEKIITNAKEKGGDALLTYNHFNIKPSYYKKAIDGKFDKEAAKKEFEKTYKKISLNLTQTQFQREVGRLEVLGELLINQNKTMKTSQLKQIIKEEVQKILNEENGSEFYGPGLAVEPRNSIDRDNIEFMLDDVFPLDQYNALWNAAGGYYFFREDEQNLDALEVKLSKEFRKREINARIDHVPKGQEF